MNHANKKNMFAQVTIAIKAIYRLRVLYCNPEARNIMCNNFGSVYIVNFEHSKIKLNKQEEKKRLSTKRKQHLGMVLPHQTQMQFLIRLDLFIVKI